MKFARPLAILIACLAGSSLVSTPARADFSQWQVDIGYADLANRLGSQLPTGQNVRALQVEADFLTVGGYMPDLAQAEFSGKTVTDLTNNPGTYSWHATEVARYYYGNLTSMTPGISTVGVYQSTDFESRILFRSYPNMPPADLSSYDVVNHSWIGSGEMPVATQTALARFDYQIAQSGIFAVAGMNNVEQGRSGQWSGYDVPAWWGSSHNSLAVGVSSAYSSYGPSQIGTAKPELVVPVSKTSWATAVVSSAGAMMIDGSTARGWDQGRDGRVLKTLMMAGATKLDARLTVTGATGTPYTAPAWHQGDSNITDTDHTQPLDWYQGAGQLNVSHSWDILRMGQQGPSDSINVSHTGYDLHAVSAAGPQRYFFDLTDQATTFSAVLNWYSNVTGMVSGAWSNTTSTPNLDLRLYAVTPDTYTLTGSPLQASHSMVDNVEHVFSSAGLAPGRYVLVVDGAQVGNTYALAWQSLTPILSGDANTDGAVDVGDLGILGANYGSTSGKAWVSADFTGDGIVDVGDLGVLGANYGLTLAAGGYAATAAQLTALSGGAGIGSSAIPEPTTLSLLALGLLALRRRAK